MVLIRTKRVLVATAILLFGTIVACSNVNGKQIVIFDTTVGTITIELYPEDAPITTQNFLQYVNAGFFNGTIFHRVIPGFVIQGGGYQSGLVPKQTNAPIKNEAANGLSNARGTLSMARTSVVDSATSQFFINLTDNTVLDHRDTSDRGYGYAVFGRVIAGMDVVDQIAAQPTGSVGGFQDVPATEIVITAARVQ